MPDNAGTAAGGADGGLAAEYQQELERLKDEVSRALPPGSPAHSSLQRLYECAMQGGNDSRVDFATGLLNLRGLTEVYGRLLNEITNPNGRRRNSPDAIVVLSFDLVDFKGHNKALTWTGGNKVLRAFADILTSSLRMPRDVAARHGGDEFLVCCLVNTKKLSINTSADDFAQRLLERIRAACNRYNGGNPVAIIEFIALCMVVTSQEPLGLPHVLSVVDPKGRHKQ